MKKCEKVDRFHYHEAIDRTYCVIEMIENILIHHPVMSKHKKIKKEIRKAQKTLIDSYQMIGNVTELKYPHHQKKSKKVKKN